MLGTGKDTKPPVAARCGHCDFRVAIRRCDECAMNQCVQCATAVHGSARRASHTVTDRPCLRCAVATPVFVCFTCAESLQCRDCSLACHAVADNGGHVVVAFEAASQAAPVPPPSPIVPPRQAVYGPWVPPPGPLPVQHFVERAYQVDSVEEGKPPAEVAPGAGPTVHEDSRAGASAGVCVSVCACVETRLAHCSLPPASIVSAPLFHPCVLLLLARLGAAVAEVAFCAHTVSPLTAPSFSCAQAATRGSARSASPSTNRTRRRVQT